MKYNVENTASGVPLDPNKVDYVYDTAGAPSGFLAGLIGDVAAATKELMEKRARRAEVARIPVTHFLGGDSVKPYENN